MPHAPLVAALAWRKAEIEMAAAAIFCSTIELADTRLDMQSETYDELPYDVENLTTFSPFPWMKATKNFPALLKRKIYTYNCFSGCIAYLGAYKGYQWYAEAANDTEIAAILDRIAEPLNQTIAKNFGITIEEQTLFSQAALRKFRDASIRDDIPRNARNVFRKLAPHDRLGRTGVTHPGKRRFDRCARNDDRRGASLSRSGRKATRGNVRRKSRLIAVFAQISGCSSDSVLVRRVLHYFQKLMLGGQLLKILDS